MYLDFLCERSYFTFLSLHRVNSRTSAVEMRGEALYLGGCWLKGHLSYPDQVHAQRSQPTGLLPMNLFRAFVYHLLKVPQFL